MSFCLRIPPLLLTAALLVVSCQGKQDCPEGMRALGDRSVRGKELWCGSPDRSQAQWTEMQNGGKATRQVCPYSAGMAEGRYRSWFPSGKVWIEGMYRGGQKAGKWVQYNEDGAVVAKAEYRFGRFVAGAPVGRMARCEEMNP